MFDPSSRYASVETYQVLDAQGNTVTIKKIRFIPVTNSVLSRQIIAGDRPDLMAYAYYQDATRFWRIADANQVMDPAELVATPGQWISIPPRS